MNSLKRIDSYLLIFFLLVTSTSCDTEEIGKAEIDKFSEYYLAVKEDAGNRWEFTTDTVRLWFDDKSGQPVLQIRNQESSGPWKEWDIEMNSTSYYDSLWFDQDEKAVQGYFYENNDFYVLIGKGPTKTLRTYWLNDQNLINEILIYWIPEENTPTSEYLKPIMDWALVHDSTEIRELYPDNRIVPSLENARKWKVLLGEYNNQKEN